MVRSTIFKPSGSIAYTTKVEACSSLSNILSCLNNAFTSVIASFFSGRVKSSDRETLIRISNTSRVEVLDIFEDLSKRLSESSSSLESRDRPAKTKRDKRKRTRKAKSTVFTKPTALGPASKDGLIRAKSKKKDIVMSKAQAQSGKAKIVKSSRRSSADAIFCDSREARSNKFATKSREK